ncbi:peptide deformylase [Longicatena caecimuris]|uniref:Peptide deformylase n=1 Tax=Longicatena caecimuris TaxID=1796635 RepID=A0A4V2VK38_9FIRM|nr:peptide deformylase [Longicatena caecimuris]MCR1870513.1 peptide deformylase [Longicatena caecimuris]MCU0103090.1 peptide deformylase [Longicatena caecimuris]TCU58405.1 peptide deformylase [Longicatena caecimuris]
MSFNYDNIVKDSDPIVREKSVTVPIPMHEEDKELLMDMLQYVHDSQDSELAEKQNLRPAVGIAAIQLGIPKKMLAVVVPKDEEEDYEFALANPKIISESIQKAYLKNGEGCLSVEEEHEGIVPRAARIKVKGFDLLRNEEIVISASGYLAIVLQHEMDHFNGTLFYDHINVTNPWQEIPDAKVIE